MTRDAVVTMEGMGRRVTVRGVYAIGGYTGDKLTLLLEKGQIVLEGESIGLEKMGEGEIVAAGKIVSVRFEG